MELDGSGDKDKATLDALLTSLITGLLQLSTRDVALSQMSTRSPQHEVKLVVLRLLSVLMSRTRGTSKSTTEVRTTKSVSLLRALNYYKWLDRRVHSAVRLCL